MFDVLVVDSDKRERKKTVNCVKIFSKYRTTESSNIDDALSKLLRKNYQLVITELNFPNAKEISLCESVRRMNIQVPIIIVTYETNFFIMKDLFRYHIDGYFFKPVDMLKLQNFLSNFPQKDIHIKHKNFLVQQVIDIINKEFRSSLSLNYLSQEVGLSSSYLSRLFKKETGVSITKYILNLRMRVARDLLENSVMKIIEISNSVGIENSSYFNKLFKQLYGMTPSDYRNNL